MLRKLGIGLIVAAVANTCTLQAKESEQGHPLKGLLGQTAAPAVLRILKTKLVAKELKLTDEQTKAIDPMLKEMHESTNKVFKENSKLPKERGQKLEELNAEYLKKLKKMLTPAQFDRLLEIVVQMGGPMMLFSTTDVFLESDVVKLFGLTDEQVAKIKEIDQELEKKSAESVDSITPAPPTGSPEEMRKQMQEQLKAMMKDRVKKMPPILKEANGKAVKILTPAQREKLAQMKGKEIDIPKLFDEMAESGELPGM